MVGTNVKAETMSLMQKRTAMEVKMNAIIERLCQPGGPGLSGNLVDSEGWFLLLLFFIKKKFPVVIFVWKRFSIFSVSSLISIDFGNHWSEGKPRIVLLLSYLCFLA
ncbi:hypothetical protein HS088_TW23G00607 [Tripterygium wilfordii]|uniref:Uncharacterized protein n=1 Tax=Tripterygium wilfordii TaxID=458696 RepID=A0A7J7BWG4_TRIWF|nr:hypothetical protein HS088_TW23G00607 [Tripterygium wilfordii]